MEEAKLGFRISITINIIDDKYWSTFLDLYVDHKPSNCEG